ncbi:MAG: bifunctional phosphoglucose/phosphomannose isomerase [Anaerolineaceae bacterium]|nr:bifunctional phosphoglucose/phosphomannose isomerase [Anaerolineaceae bacterium]
MKINSPENFKNIDPDNMLEAIRGLPDQLKEALNKGNEYPLPNGSGFTKVIIAGMGGSAIGADLLAAYVYKEIRIPLFVLRGYKLPGWARGEKCLVICSSHSGNTEETNSILSDAIENGCTIVVISTGGNLIKRASDLGVCTWHYDHIGQPRAAVGWSFGLLLKLFERLSLIPDQSAASGEAVAAMNAYKKEIDADVPTALNPAKRMAGQLVNHYITVFGAEHLSPVARRWKTQINELAKCWSQFEFIPEADHNTLAGVLQPTELLPKIFAIFLQSENYHARNNKRTELTFTQFMVAGICTDKIKISAGKKLAEMWKAILLGDYISYYLAMIYEMDPTPVDAIESLKKQMQ